MKLSPSGLNMYEKCQRCFYETYNENNRPPRGIFPSLPSGMDKVLKNYFGNYASKGMVPPEVEELGMNLKPIDQGLLETWMNQWKGISWTDEDGNTLAGAVDCVLQDDSGKLLVLDYKTRGFPLKENTAGHYKLQMDTYNFLLRKNGYETHDISALLFYYPDSVEENGVVRFKRELVTLETDTDNAESVFREAIACLRGEKPEASNGCENHLWASSQRS